MRSIGFMCSLLLAFFTTVSLHAADTLKAALMAGAATSNITPE